MIPTAGTLRHSDGGADVDHAMAGHVIPLLEPGARTGVSTSDRRAGIGIGADGDPMFTLLAGKQHGVAVAFGQNRQSGPVEASHALNAHAGPYGRLDFESETFLVQSVAGDIAHALNTANGGTGRGEDRTGRGVPTIAFGAKDNPQPGGPSHPLAAGAHAPAIAFPSNLSGTQYASAVDVTPAMGAKNPTAVAFQDRFRGDDGRGYVRPPPTSEQVIGTLETVKPWNVVTGLAVRRLTPIECERLQGFPDNWTLIPTEKRNWHREREDMRAYLARQFAEITDDELDRLAADGPRYKAIGNSMAVPVMRWIGERIQAVEDITRERVPAVRAPA